MVLHGVDFTSAPCKRKGITIATGVLEEGIYRLQSLTALHDFDAFDAWLRQSGPWLGAFDFPFSFPRELVETLGWPADWTALIQHAAKLSRSDLRNTFQAFCNARPVGNKFAHRATDYPAGSSSPMKWVNPPVAYMLHAGVPRLIDAGLTIYTLHAGDPQRIALEAYPGLLARSITRASYKTDERAKQTLLRQEARLQIVEALEKGIYRLGVPLDAGPYREALIADPSGDWLDATLCGLAAAWAWQRRETSFGLPQFDPLEGWIVGA
jgi:hypothetical protein